MQIWAWLALWALWLGGEGKLVRKTLAFKPGSTWHYLTKFGISIGEGEFEVTARFKSPFVPPGMDSVSTTVYNVSIHFYLDTKWMAALEESNCPAKATHEIRLEKLEVPGNGDWAFPRMGMLRQRTRPYVWFVAASDCDQSLHSAYPSMPQLEFSIRFTGHDGGEFSHEEIGLLSLYSLALLIFTGLLGYLIYSYYKDIKKTESIESPILILLIAVVFEFISLLLQWLHLLVYSFDGQGLKACDVISIMAEVSSQFFLSLLLILLSWGWTITYMGFNDVEMGIPLVVMLLMVHLILGGLTELTSDAYHKYHDFEGIQGILLVVARLGMFAYFLYGMRETYRKARLRAKEFLYYFGVYAGGYLLAFPLLVVICRVFAHYERHKVMSIGTITTQTAAMCLLLRLFVGRTSYTQVSMHGDTILPGGKYD